MDWLHYVIFYPARKEGCLLFACMYYLYVYLFVLTAMKQNYGYWLIVIGPFLLIVISHSWMYIVTIPRVIFVEKQIGAGTTNHEEQNQWESFSLWIIDGASTAFLKRPLQ